MKLAPVRHAQFVCYDCECRCHDNLLLVVCCMHSLCVTTVSIIVMTTCCW